MNYPTVREAIEMLMQHNGAPSSEFNTVFAKVVLSTPVTIMKLAEEQAARAKDLGRIAGIAVEHNDVLNHLHHSVLDQVLNTANDFLLEEHDDYRAYHH